VFLHRGDDCAQGGLKLEVRGSVEGSRLARDLDKVLPGQIHKAKVRGGQVANSQQLIRYEAKLLQEVNPVRTPK